MPRQRASSVKPDLPSFQTKLRSLFPQTTDEASWTTSRRSTGVVPVDWALSGGFGYGRLIEIFGNYSSGKTHLLYLALIEAQREGCLAILIETEGAFDPVYYQRLGGDPSTLFVMPADTVEEVFDGISKIAGTEEFQNKKVVVGWDSIAATNTKHLEEKGMDKRDMTKALVMSQGCQLVCNKIRDAGICFIAVNQVRDKIDRYASGPQTPGGRSYPFFASQRIELRYDGGDVTSRIEDSSKNPVGRWLRVWIEKSKLGPAMRSCQLPFYFEDGREHPIFKTETRHGIDRVEALFEFYSGVSSRFRLAPKNPDDPPWSGKPVISCPSSGWFLLDKSIDPNAKNFRAKDWPKVLEDNPVLQTLPLQSPMGDSDVETV